MLSTLPLAIILVELVAGVVVFVFGLSFITLIYTAAWGILVWYAALRAAVVLNALGAALAAVSILGSRQERGRFLRNLGLLLNLITLGVAWQSSCWLDGWLKAG